MENNKSNKHLIANTPLNAVYIAFPEIKELKGKEKQQAIDEALSKTKFPFYKSNYKSHRAMMLLNDLLGLRQALTVEKAREEAKNEEE